MKTERAVTSPKALAAPYGQKPASKKPKTPEGSFAIRPSFLVALAVRNVLERQAIEQWEAAHPEVVSGE